MTPAGGAASRSVPPQPRPADRRLRIYGKLPVLLQHAACSLEGWRIQRTRYGRRFVTLLEHAAERGFWPEARVEEYRDQRLRLFLRASAGQAPYYRAQWRALGCSPEDLRLPGDLAQLPILSKGEVQERASEFLSAAVGAELRRPAHTSGTTGAGLHFATTIEAEQEQWAVWWRYRRWHGIEPGTWCGYFGGRSIVPLEQRAPPFWRINHPARQILFSGYHLSERNLAAFAGELRLRRPPWLHGYPSLLGLLAAHLIDRGSDLGYPVRWITTGAENLFPAQAALMERAFGVRPRQHYGMAEAVANFSECERGRLHVDEDFSFVEFVPSSLRPFYRVVGTNFTNFATPLVRYEVHDLVSLGWEPCSCGRPGRIVERVDGRREDYVILRNGARVGRMDHVFKDMVNIREAQIYQCRPGEIVLRVVRGAAYTPADEQKLIHETRLRTGVETTITVEYPAKIERTASGKLRFVVSDILGARIAEPSGPADATA